MLGGITVRTLLSQMRKRHRKSLYVRSGLTLTEIKARFNEGRSDWRRRCTTCEDKGITAPHPPTSDADALCVIQINVNGWRSD